VAGGIVFREGFILWGELKKRHANGNGCIYSEYQFIAEGVAVESCYEMVQRRSFSEVIFVIAEKARGGKKECAGLAGESDVLQRLKLENSFCYRVGCSF